MNKKIQVSTVRQEADVEVIFVNSHLINKAIRAQIALDNALADTRSPRIAKDENGSDVVDENGKPVQDKDENGNLLYDYNYRGIRDEKDIIALHETVKSFIDELTSAFV